MKVNLNGVEELDWSAQTPDSNTIVRKADLRARPDHPTSVLELTNALVSEWEKIPAAGSTSGGKSETRGVEAVRAAQ